MGTVDSVKNENNQYEITVRRVFLANKLRSSVWTNTVVSLVFARSYYFTDIERGTEHEFRAHGLPLAILNVAVRDFRYICTYIHIYIYIYTLRSSTCLLRVIRRLPRRRSFVTEI